MIQPHLFLNIFDIHWYNNYMICIYLLQARSQSNISYKKYQCILCNLEIFDKKGIHFDFQHRKNKPHIMNILETLEQFNIDCNFKC